MGEVVSCPHFILLFPIAFLQTCQGPWASSRTSYMPSLKTKSFLSCSSIWKTSHAFTVENAFPPSPRLDNSLKGLNRSLWNLPKAICFRAGPQTWEIAVRKEIWEIYKQLKWMPLEWRGCFRPCYRSHYNKHTGTWVSGSLASTLFSLWWYHYGRMYQVCSLGRTAKATTEKSKK